MEQLKKRVQALVEQLTDATKKIELDKLREQLESLQAETAKPDFWRDSDKAQQISRRQAALSSKVTPWKELQEGVDELNDLVNMSDAGMSLELTKQCEQLEKKLAELKKQLRFQGEYDDHDVILSIYAGAGGTDAQDWAQMLLRMYSRYADGQKLKLKTIEQSPGETAGLKSVSVELAGGDYLYGKLSGEHGVHRLVRLSPFNADNLRQTSFAKVEILPLIDEPSELTIDEKDLKVDVFRSAGAGGQSVNTTDSAVRITHLPTGIVVAIQNERSQLQNKETAMAILRSKLIALKLEQHAQNLSQIKGPSQSAEWGNQIRSYVLHPYKQVKDLRTGYQTSNAEKVLDGDLSPFIDAWVEQN